jgi:hypothetical protein
MKQPVREMEREKWACENKERYHDNNSPYPVKAKVACPQCLVYTARSCRRAKIKRLNRQMRLAGEPSIRTFIPVKSISIEDNSQIVEDLHQVPTGLSLRFIPSRGFVVTTPAGIAGLSDAGSISKAPTKAATKHLNSAFAKFAPMQLRGPCKKVS